VGGDEFVVVAAATAGVPGMIALAAAILSEVSCPIPLRVGRVCISACAGIAECAAGSLAPASLIADADAALYVAKAHGSGRWAVYGASLEAERPQGS
jgi:predicted signal transduction protein with EAL and GGDEF domain